MAFVVTEPCSGCRYTDCVVVCPTECFYERGQMLVIDPDDCIDCEACAPECPVDAIYHDTNVPARGGESESLPSPRSSSGSGISCLMRNGQSKASGLRIGKSP